MAATEVQTFDLVAAVQQIASTAGTMARAHAALVEQCAALVYAAEGVPAIRLVPAVSVDTMFDVLGRARGIVEDIEFLDELPGVVREAQELAAVVAFHAGREAVTA